NNQSDPNAYPALGYALLHTRGQDIAVNLTSTFSSNKVNVVRFNYLPSIIRLDAFQQGPNFNQQAGITGFEQTLLPTTGGSFPDFSWSGDVSSMQETSPDQLKSGNDPPVVGSNVCSKPVMPACWLKFGPCWKASSLIMEGR